MSSSRQSTDRDTHVAAQSYDYGRILDLLDRIRTCTGVVRDALLDRTLDGNLRARNYAAQIETDARELQALLLERHLDIQRGLDRATA